MSLVNKLLDKITEYIRLKGENLKLEIIARFSRILAHLLTFLCIALIAVFMLIFLSFALGAYLNAVLDSPHLGYLIVAGIYLLLLIVMIILLQSNKIQIWLETLFVNLGEHINDDDEH